MNKKNIFNLLFLVILLTSCGRENFKMTQLQINLPKSSSHLTDNSFYWIHIYNPTTGFYFSDTVNPGANNLEINVPNSPNYILYAYKMHREDIATATSSIRTSKAFFTPLDLNIGGVKLININLKNETLNDPRFFKREFNSVLSDGIEPRRLLFRPCQPSESETLSLESCPIEITTLNEGAIQSMKISLFKYTGGRTFSPINQVWSTGCKRLETNHPHIDSDMKIPVTKNTATPMHIQFDFFLDKECQFLDATGQSKTGFPLEREGVLLKPVRIDTGGDIIEISAFIFQNDKLGIGKTCVENHNCHSGICDITLNVPICVNSTEQPAMW